MGASGRPFFEKRNPVERGRNLDGCCISCIERGRDIK